MSLVAYALTTVARQKTAIELSGSTHDTLLEILINVCTDFVEGFCNRRFKQTAYTNEVYDGTGQKTLVLKNYPVISGQTITLQRRASTLNEDDWDSFESEHFHVDYDSGILTSMVGRFFDYPRHYRVSYTAGYNFDNAGGATLESVGLGDLEYAVWELVKKAYYRRKSSSDVASESIGDYSVAFRESAMADPIVLQILQRYVRTDAQL